MVEHVALRETLENSDPGLGSARYAGSDRCLRPALEGHGLRAAFVGSSALAIVNWDLRESMTEADVAVIFERAKELHPEARSRIISDNGPQFIAKSLKGFIRISGMTRVRTSPYYPQSKCPPEQRGWLHHPEGEMSAGGRLQAGAAHQEGESKSRLWA